MLNKIKVWWRGTILTDEDLSYSYATQTERSKREARGLEYEKSAEWKLKMLYRKYEWFKLSVIILLIIIIVK